MDTSKEYIKMCERAEEIQGEWNPSLGDWVLNMSAIGEPYLFVNYSFQPFSDKPTFKLVVEKGDKKSFLIWLPRQDQLQEMVDFFDNIEKEAYFNGFIREHFIDGTHKWDKVTMEQLWLAFVMHEKYGKHWTGKEWKGEGE